MSNKTQRKIGFFSALTILVGTMVGVGIFFKNNSISSIVEGNGISWLLSWILGALIAIFTALAYTEISTAKSNKKLSGLSYWASTFSGKKLGYLTRFNYAFFYYPIFVVVLGIFASQIFFQFLSLINPSVFQNIQVWVHVIFGFCLSMIYFVLNKMSIWVAGIHQNIVTILKFIPLFVAIIVGLVFANVNNIPEKPVPPSNIIPNPNAFLNGEFNFSKTLFAIPAVLFTLDTFLIVGTITHKVKGGEKTVTKVVSIGMLFVSFVYILITVASILHNAGTVEILIQDSLAPEFSKGVAIFVNFFVFISSLGVINGMFAAFIGETENATFSQTWFGSKFLSKKFGIKKAMYFFYIFSYLFWSLIIFIPSLILNSDSIIDAISNFPTLFFFLIYGLVVFFYLIKRKKITETNKINSSFFYVVSILSILGITIAIFSQLVILLLNAINFPLEPSSFGSLGTKISNLDFMILSLVFIALFFLIPYLNYLLIKYFEKRNPLILPKDIFPMKSMKNEFFVQDLKKIDKIKIEYESK